MCPSGPERPVSYVIPLTVRSTGPCDGCGRTFSREHTSGDDDHVCERCRLRRVKAAIPYLKEPAGPRLYLACIWLLRVVVFVAALKLLVD